MEKFIRKNAWGGVTLSLFKRKNKKDKSKKEEKILTRNSNFELLRIVSMFLIVLYHVIVHGHVINNTNNPNLKIIVYIIELITIVHVNSFVLVTGYFQSKSKFKLSKIWKIFNSTLFYQTLLIIILISTGLISLGRYDLIRNIVFSIHHYWFIETYLYLFCLSPFINYLINNLYKDYYQKLLLVIFVLISVLPYVFGIAIFNNNGHSLYSFVFLYLLGGYLRKYPLEKHYIFERMSKPLLQIVLISIFFACVFLNFSTVVATTALKDVNQMFRNIYSNNISFSIYYNNPLIVIQTFAFFAFFGTLNIKSKLINKLGKLTLGVYLIHDNIYVRKVLYRMLLIDRPVYSYRFVIYMLSVACFIFMVCAFIEFCRQLLFRFIYKRKISTKIRNKFNDYIKNIKIIKTEENNA